MYLPDMFAVTDPDEIDFVLSNVRLGCLVTRDAAGFFGTHLPMLFDPAGRVLAGHVAKPNPHPDRCGDGEAIAIFQGMNAYITPSWYPSKLTHGKAVPTWSYEVAHVSGRLTWRREADWLRDHLARLTERFERPRAKPWALSDAPEDFLEALIGGVVGVELAIEQVQVKRKLSQRHSPSDQQGVMAGLFDSANPEDRRLGELMARLGISRLGD